MKFKDVNYYLPADRVDVLAICSHILGGRYYALLYLNNQKWYYTSGGIFTGKVLGYKLLKDANSDSIKIKL